MFGGFCLLTKHSHMLLKRGDRRENTYADTWLALTICLAFNPGIDELPGLICSCLKADSFQASII